MFLSSLCLVISTNPISEIWIILLSFKKVNFSSLFKYSRSDNWSSWLIMSMKSMTIIPLIFLSFNWLIISFVAAKFTHNIASLVDLTLLNPPEFTSIEVNASVFSIVIWTLLSSTQCNIYNFWRFFRCNILCKFYIFFLKKLNSFLFLILHLLIE